MRKNSREPDKLTAWLDQLLLILEWIISLSALVIGSLIIWGLPLLGAGWFCGRFSKRCFGFWAAWRASRRSRW
ncbi:MAG: hypothetical protein AAFY26_27230, partial [Cyanobacteria bacterium J06638_22]